MRIFILFFALCCSVLVYAFSDTKQRRFNDGFLFGTSSAAYQVEGAWNEDGKGKSIWDHYFHSNPERYPTVPGDVAADSYHNYKRDVEMLRELGVNFYRFSISWTRVLPTGFHNNKNEFGLQYYDNLIDELLKYDIQPMVVLYHFDLPQILQDLGGWANPLSIDWFENYAKVIFDRYAHKVKYWITVNQPNSVCISEGNEFPIPGTTKGIMDYLCAKNIMIAHAKAYRLYEKKYKKKYGGSVGISISVNWADPLTNSTADVEAAEDHRQFSFGIFMNPIWAKYGDFPKRVKDKVARRSKEQGFANSRLPSLSKEEIKLIKGSADFLGMNYYTTVLVSPSSRDHPSPSFDDDLRTDTTTGEQWVQAQSPWLKSVPYGIYKACLYLNKEYDYPEIIVTESGWSTRGGRADAARAAFLRQHLRALQLALEDGAALRGYSYRGLMDHVEWAAGTSERFGLYEVDFESSEKTRSARESALVYKRIIQKRIVEEEWRPKNLKISISKKVKDEL